MAKEPEKSMEVEEAEDEASENEEKESSPKDKEAESETAETESAGGEKDAADAPAGEKDESAGKDGEFDDELLARAERAGIAKDQALSFGNPENLETALSLNIERIVKLGGGADEEDEEDEEEEVPPRKKGAEAVEKTPSEVVEEFKLSVGEDDLDPNLIKDLKALAERAGKVGALEREVKALRDEFIERKAADEETARERFFNDYDSAVEELAEKDESVAEVLGRGGRNDLGKNSEEMKNRRKHVLDIAAYVNGLKKLKMEVPSVREVVLGTFRMRFGKHQVQAERKKVAGELEKRRGQAISRPTGRRGKALTGLDAAVQLAEEYERTHTVP